MVNKPISSSKYSLTKADLYFLLLFLLGSNVFTIYFINQENYIYFWDTANYWLKCISMRETFINSPTDALKSLFTSIQYDDYNNIAAFFLLPFSLVFGPGRLAYILSIVNMFSLPAAISFLLLIKKLNGESFNAISPIVSFIAIFTILSCPFFWSPTLYGYVDVGGILLINVILLLLFKRPFSEQTIGNLLLLGFLLALLVLFRRWYTFWVISLFIAIALTEFLYSFSEYRFAYKKCLSTLVKFILITVFTSAFFMISAKPLAERIIKINYADIYSAYRFSTTIMQVLQKSIAYFGLFYVVLFLFGSIYLFATQAFRRFSLVLVLQLTIAYLLFSKTQDFSYQHYYLLLPTMLLFISIFIINLLLKAPSKIVAASICTIYVLLSLLNFAAMFLPSATAYAHKTKHIFSAETHYPLKRNDIDKIKNLLKALENQLIKEPNSWVYVLSSSVLLNYSILQTAAMTLSGNTTLFKQILNTHDVDKRDGFPTEFLSAQYVVIGYPIQYHLSPDDQRVVGVLADAIIRQENIGKSFIQLPYMFVLDNNVRVFIYKKVRPFCKADIEALSELFKKYYPDREFLCNIEWS